MGAEIETKPRFAIGSQLHRIAVWRRDGKEILYFNRDPKPNLAALSSPMALGSQLRFAAPEPPFSVSQPLPAFGVSDDGLKNLFLAIHGGARLGCHSGSNRHDPFARTRNLSRRAADDGRQRFYYLFLRMVADRLLPDAPSSRTSALPIPSKLNWFTRMPV